MDIIIRADGGVVQQYMNRSAGEYSARYDRKNRLSAWHATHPTRAITSLDHTRQKLDIQVENFLDAERAVRMFMFQLSPKQ
jgi:hypothetical protein